MPFQIVNSWANSAPGLSSTPLSPEFVRMALNLPQQDNEVSVNEARFAELRNAAVSAPRLDEIW